MIQLLPRSLVIALIAITTSCFLSEHRASAGTVGATIPAPRKKATSQARTATAGQKSPVKAFNLFIRSTSFSHDEEGSDSDSSALQSKTGVRQQYWTPRSVGTAAVDPRVIPFGSLIIVMDERQAARAYLAVDTGKDVRLRTASRKLSAAKKRRKECAYSSPQYSNAPVVDFFSKGNRQVGSEWTTVMVVPPESSFLDMKASKRKSLLLADAWEKTLARCVLPVAEQALIAAR